jgi:hexosaminidase
MGIIAFKEARTIHKVGVSFIRDHKSWIFAPSKITIEASLNGIDYFTVAQKDLQQATPTDKNPFKDEVLIDIDNDKGLKYKYLRYSISNPGLLPAWHLGAGNPTWLFVDELLHQ